MRPPRLFGIFFAIMFTLVLLTIIGGMVFSFMAYQECRAEGNPMYRCSAAIQNPNYVWIDDQ